MQSLFGIIQTLFVCVTILGAVFVVCLSLKDSQLREFLLPVVSWIVAIFCAVLVISPVDFLPEALLGPFGLIDDLAALATGIAAARMAMTTKKQNSHS